MTTVSPVAVQQELSAREQASTDQIRQKLPGTANLPANDTSVGALKGSLDSWARWVKSNGVAPGSR
jgi:hypothetical protein